MAFYEKFIIDSDGTQITSAAQLDGLDIGTVIRSNSNEKYIKTTYGWNKADVDGNLDITTQGNEFNGPSELVRMDSDGKLPLLDASKLFNLNSSELLNRDSILLSELNTSGFDTTTLDFSGVFLSELNSSGFDVNTLDFNNMIFDQGGA